MPAVLLIFPQIFIEQIAQFIRRYADTVIFNGDDNILAIVAAKDADFAALDLGVLSLIHISKKCIPLIRRTLLRQDE